MKTTSAVARGEEWGDINSKGEQENFGVLEMFYILVVITMVTRYIHLSSQQNLY